jgi:DNA-binding MarR family transcriptional regulator
MGVDEMHLTVEEKQLLKLLSENKNGLFMYQIENAMKLKYSEVMRIARDLSKRYWIIKSRTQGIRTEKLRMPVSVRGKVV